MATGQIGTAAPVSSIPPMMPASPFAPVAPPPGLEMVPIQTVSLPVAQVPPIPPPSSPPTQTLPLQGQQQDVESWPVQKVMDWLNASGLGHLSNNFEEHRITGDVLFELSSSDLEDIGIHAFGDKKRLLRGIGQLRCQKQLPLPAQAMEQQFLCPPPPSWEAPSFETDHVCVQGPCPPSTPPPTFMELYQCPPPAFSAPM